MALDLQSTFVVLKPDQAAALVEVTPSVYEDLDRHFDGFRGHTLVSIYSFERDWPTWERHPAGDEVVCLLSGEADMVLELDVPTRMLFVTPGEGTQNRPVPPP